MRFILIVDAFLLSYFLHECGVQRCPGSPLVSEPIILYLFDVFTILCDILTRTYCTLLYRPTPKTVRPLLFLSLLSISVQTKELSSFILSGADCTPSFYFVPYSLVLSLYCLYYYVCLMCGVCVVLCYRLGYVFFCYILLLLCSPIISYLLPRKLE